MDKYEEMKSFILENFETTSNKKDRLHTEDIINLLYIKGGFYIAQRKQLKFLRVWE